MIRFWLQAVLVISLAFNIAFVIMHFVVEPPHPPHGPEAFVDRVTRQMTPNDAAIVQGAFAAHKAEFADQRHAMDAAISNVRKVLGHDPVNQDDLKSAMDEARAARTSSEEIMERTILEAAKGLSPEGRLQLVPPPPPPGH